jgi:hypothetical protein
MVTHLQQRLSGTVPCDQYLLKLQAIHAVISVPYYRSERSFLDCPVMDKVNVASCIYQFDIYLSCCNLIPY